MEDQEFELEKQQRHIFEEQRGFSDEYYELDRQLGDINDEIIDIESRLHDLKDLSFEKSENVPFFIFGIFMVLISFSTILGVATAAKARSTAPGVLETLKQADTVKAPKVATTCPQCGATTLPDDNGRCEYCGGAAWNIDRFRE